MMSEKPEPSRQVLRVYRCLRVAYIELDYAILKLESMSEATCSKDAQEALAWLYEAVADIETKYQMPDPVKGGD